VEVTTVVMTRDRWADLRRSLPHHVGPVILVDNGSRDGTPSLVRTHFPHVRVVELHRNLGATARNIGVQHAATPLVAFADDDSWWAEGALSRAGGIFAGFPRLAVLAGRTLVGAAQVEDPFCATLADSPLGTPAGSPGPSVLGFMACAAVVRRDAFLAVGGFDDVVFFMGEEERLALDLAARGWDLSYASDVVAHHHPSADRDAASRRRREELVWRNRLLTAVMRRPWRRVLAQLREALRNGRSGRRGAARALPRVPRAVRVRHRLPDTVEDLLDVIEAHRLEQGAAPPAQQAQEAREV
jgi:GT2 family glycosyltransferase